MIELKSMKLTEAGALALGAFPPSAISHADEEMVNALQSQTVKDAFGLFCKFANDWCTERNVRPSWREAFRTLEEGGFTKETPRVEVLLIKRERVGGQKLSARHVSEESSNPVPNVGYTSYCCCYFKGLNRDERFDYLEKQLGLRMGKTPPRLDIEGNPWPKGNHYTEKLVCIHNNEPMPVFKEGYEEEQRLLPTMTKADKIAKLMPAVDNLKKMNPQMREAMIACHPFPDAKELFAELLDPQSTMSVQEANWNALTELEQRATWEHVVPEMAKMSSDERRKVLESYQMPFVYTLLETMIEEHNAQITSQNV